ncbi:MAG: metalloregulator ArsR/SmtB family transcription factor, partial [Gaiellales bacterium]
LPHPIPPRLAEMIAERFRVLAEPMRLRLLDHLREGEATVGELADVLGTTQQNVSKHLKLLVDNGVVARTRRGTASYCSIADPLVFDLCESICGGIQSQSREVAELFEVSTPSTTRTTRSK